MAISFRAETHLNQAGASTIVLNKPTGVVSGDVMYASIYTGNNDHASLAGWTEVAFQIDTAANAVTVLRKVAGGAEPASYTFTAAGTGLTNGAIAAYIGVDNTTPEDATPTTSNGTGASVIAPTITTVTANAWWVAMFETDGAATTLSLPTGFTNDVPTYGASGDFMRVDHKLIVTAGATGTATSTQDDTGGWITVSLAIRPVVSGGVIDQNPVRYGYGANN